MPGIYQCENRHSYDVARQGYINLLPVQFKKSKDPGDSKEMVQARSAFLQTGLYQPVVDKLNALILAHVGKNSTPVILDAGCGEGWYTDSLFQSLQKNTLQPVMMGLDISKWAIQAATRRSKSICWMVATNSHPPVLAGTVDVIFSIFGFPQAEKLRPLLKPGGLMITVSAGSDHLFELREKIYTTVEQESVTQSEDSQSDLVEKLRFTLTDLTQETLPLLLKMTPHYYKASRDKRDKVLQSGLDRCTVDMQFTLFENM